MPQYITVTDFILLPFVLLVILRVALYLRDRHFPRHHPHRKFFIPALFAKIAGGLAFAFIYVYYYGYGDTFRFYDMGRFFTNILKNDPTDFFQVYFTGGDAFFTPKSFIYNFDYLYNHHLPNILAARISSFLGLFLFNSYLFITIGFSILAFTGIWKLFRMFSVMFPSFTFSLAIAILFLPSAIFWGSGLLKDTITLGAMGWFTYGIWLWMYKKAGLIKILFILLLSGALMGIMKSYILVSYVPAVLIWIGSHYYKQIRNGDVKKLVWVALIGTLIFMATRAEEIVEAQQRQIQELAKSALLVSSILEYYEAGSSYDLGVDASSAASVIKAAPLAVATSLYRPFLWEVRSPVMLFSALESFLILAFTLFVLFRVGIMQFFKLIFTKGLIFFCLLFSFVFCFGVALSSNNFGTLVRYKIPAVPFYLVALLLMLYYSNKSLSLTWSGHGKKHTYTRRRMAVRAG